MTILGEWTHLPTGSAVIYKMRNPRFMITIPDSGTDLILIRQYYGTAVRGIDKYMRTHYNAET